MLLLHQAPASPAGSRTPVSFTSEDPALLRRRPMPYGLKPAQLNWQKEVTYDERGNIVDMIKLDPATFPLRRYCYIIYPDIVLKGEGKWPGTVAVKNASHCTPLVLCKLFWLPLYCMCIHVYRKPRKGKGWVYNCVLQHWCGIHPECVTQRTLQKTFFK